MKPEQIWARIAESSDRPTPYGFVDRLGLYRDWLISEALPAGGIGPREEQRVDLRHIADSLLFARGFAGSPEGILDVGTGVGLPGIPLAILLPETRFVLIDRSGRRIDLVKRAVKVVRLDNVAVVESEIDSYSGAFSVVLSRATLPPDRYRPVLERLLEPGGTGLLGGSWTDRPEHPGYETREIGSNILDRPVWILIMRNT